MGRACFQGTQCLPQCLAAGGRPRCGCDWAPPTAAPPVPPRRQPPTNSWRDPPPSPATIACPYQSALPVAPRSFPPMTVLRQPPASPPRRGCLKPATTTPWSASACREDLLPLSFIPEVGDWRFVGGGRGRACGSGGRCWQQGRVAGGTLPGLLRSLLEPLCLHARVPGCAIVHLSLQPLTNPRCCCGPLPLLAGGLAQAVPGRQACELCCALTQQRGGLAWGCESSV